VTRAEILSLFTSDPDLAAEVEALRAVFAMLERMPDLTVVEVARLALRVGVRRLAAEVRDAKIEALGADPAAEVRDPEN
jgi:hypothetical protein